MFPSGCKDYNKNSLIQFQIYSSSAINLNLERDSKLHNLKSDLHDIRRETPAVIPSSRNYWWWEKRNKHLIEELKIKKNTKLLFVGNSITHYWENEGREIWNTYYSKYNPLNLGLGGDQTQHILYRLNQYDFSEINPKVSVVLAGTNNLALGYSPEDTALGVKKIVDKLKNVLPSTSIILLALFPRGHKPNHLRKLVKSTNSILSKSFHNDKQVHFLDLGAHFMDKDKVISSEIMGDYLHLTSKGYRIWARKMDPQLIKLLSE